MVRPGKRRALLDGALTVFAREGYTRASIDAIAAEAGVSTRTLYNHFGDKAGLFQAVIEDSTRRVADAQVDIIENRLRKVTDIEADLVDFGVALIERGWGDFADHAALIRRVDAESAHVPPSAIDAWRDNGPRRVIGALGAALTRLADEGWIRVEDPELAATHLMVLISGAVPFRHGIAVIGTTDVDKGVRTGVRVFLYGYTAEKPASEG